MGNRNSSSSRSSGGPTPAGTPSRPSPHTHSSASPALSAAKAPLAPTPPPAARVPHPLDMYALPTGLYTAHVTWSSVRELVTQRKLAPRVHGLDDAVQAGMRECPLCLMFYAEYALNATVCCHSDLCSECYLHSQEPAMGRECPFCKRPGFTVRYEGDPTPLLLGGERKADGTGGGSDASFAPSPHLRSPEKERARARSRASTADLDKAIMASHGVVFAKVEDRAAIKEEITVQEVDSRRCMAAEAAARRSTPNVRFVMPSPASRPASASGAPAGASPPGSGLYRAAAAPPGAISTPLSITGMSPSPSFSRANTTSSSVAARVSGSHVSLGPPMTGTGSSSDDDDDDDYGIHEGSGRYSMAMHAAGAPSRAASLGAPAAASPSTAGTIISAALRAVSESFLGASNRAASTPAQAGSSPAAEVAWRQQLMRGSVTAGARAAAAATTHHDGDDDEHEDEESHADMHPGAGRGTLAASINHWAMRAGADGMDADALEEFMLGQAIMMSLQEAAAEAAAAAPAVAAPAAEAAVPPSARATPSMPTHVASARDVLLSGDEDDDDEAAASVRVGAAAAAMAAGSDSDEDDDDEDDEEHSHGAAASPHRVDTDGDEEAMLQLALQLSLNDAAARMAAPE